jgi:hypothetical protein
VPILESVTEPIVSLINDWVITPYFEIHICICPFDNSGMKFLLSNSAAKQKVYHHLLLHSALLYYTEVTLKVQYLLCVFCFKILHYIRRKNMHNKI